MGSVSHPVRSADSATAEASKYLDDLLKTPEKGPRMLFFSGGTALNETSRVLKHYTVNSIHLVTPFDSGGSSAKLRQAFDMPAVGDLRSRMLALADESTDEHKQVRKLLGHRLSKHQKSGELRETLSQMVSGRHRLIAVLPDPLRADICRFLAVFEAGMPEDFDLRGASIGNLAIAGGYLHYGRDLNPVITCFERFLGVLGRVRPVVGESLHLVAELEDRTLIIGQHLLTGKEVQGIGSPVRRIELSLSGTAAMSVAPEASAEICSLIRQADLICYSPGSFYSSLVTNLLPGGIREAIRDNRGLKVYVPNPCEDPEQLGMTTQDSIERLLEYLGARSLQPHSVDQVLDRVLVDSRLADNQRKQPAGLSLPAGVELVETSLITENSAPYFDPQLLARALLSLR